MRGYNERLETFDLSLEIHKFMHGGAVLNTTVLCVGMPGSGKSYTALSLAYNLAILESIRKHGDREHWREFFNMNHCAVISPDNIRKVLSGSLKEYGIYILDDVGAGGYSARKWQSKQNEMLNAIFTTFRTSRAILIMTAQTSGMIDIIARQLFNWTIECGTASAYPYGVSFCKVFKTVLKPRMPAHKRVFHYFPRGRGAVYDVCACLRPPRELSDEYDLIRGREARNLANKAEASNHQEKAISGKRRSIPQRLKEYEANRPRPSRSHRKQRAAWNRDAAIALDCSLRYIQSL